MKIFARLAPSSFLAVGLAFTVARGQTASECSLEALSDAAVEQLEIYDKGLYLEPNCANGFTPMPVHCNYMGLGQECRGCFESCDGAMKYMDDWPQEIDVWGEDAIIHFCPDSGVANLEDC